MNSETPRAGDRVSVRVIVAAFAVGLAMVAEAAINPGEKVLDKIIPAAIGTLSIGLGLAGVHANSR